MQQLWRIELFGGICVRSTDVNVPPIKRFRTERARALLAYLAYHIHRSHSREFLIEMLWPDSEPGAKQNTFRVALSSLRRQLEPPGIATGSVLIADRNTISLNPAVVTTDVGDFEALTKAAGATQHELEKIRLLTDALALYHGPLLHGQYDEWIMLEQPRLDSLVVQALRDLVKCLKEVGDVPRAIEHLQRALSFDPECEEAVIELMRLYVLEDQPASALRYYRDFERNLWKKYESRPSTATQELARLIEQQAKTVKVESGGTSGSTSNQPEGVPGGPRPPRSRPVAVGDEATRESEEGADEKAIAPSGTVTFLLFDICFSGEQEASASQRTASARQYQELVCREVSSHYGYVIRATNDSFLFAFARVSEALACAIACVGNSPEVTQGLNITEAITATQTEAPRASTAKPCLRAALFTRDAGFRDGVYYDCGYDDLERILLAAHPGQIVCAADTAALLRAQNQSRFQIVNLGLFRMAGVEEPVNLFQINSDEVPFHEFPTLNLPAVHSGNLPGQYNSFFGREMELAQLGAMLESQQHRLVTLTGMGGSGKTRLALELARRLIKTWRGEVWFVSLSDLSDAQLIFSAIRDALRLPPLAHTSPLEQVVDLLSRQPTVLLLDNFEHMLEQGAAVVELLLNRIPTLTLILTSQHRLNIHHEEEYRVDTLPTPQAGTIPAELVRNPSVQLFVDRAQAVRADFQVTDHNAREVALLCKHLDGIPLAIELAAARATTLTPSQMMVRLVEHGLDSFVNPMRNAAQRQRTLRAALDWSHRLLPVPVQHFFNQLAVFRGGWTLEAAEQVTMIPASVDGAISEGGTNGRSTPKPSSSSFIHVFEYLEHLTDASLVILEGMAPDVRYRLLETIHHYAHWQLEQNEDIELLRRRHAYYYLKMAEEAALQMQGPKQAEWVALLYREQENLRAALNWAMGAGSQRMELQASHSAWLHPSSPPVKGTTSPAPQQPRDIELALRLANALGLFWELNGHATEARAVLGRVLENSQGAQPDLRATALYYAGRLALYQNEYATARLLLEECLELRRSLGEKHAIALAMGALGSVLINLNGQTEVAEGQALEEQALEILREVGDSRNVVMALNGLAAVAMIRNDCETARSYLEEGLGLLREIGDRRGEGLSLNSLGSVAMSQDDLARARILMQQGLDIMREIDDRWGLAIALNSLAFVTMNLGDLTTARALLEESLPIFEELGIKVRLAEALSELGDVARSQGDYDEAEHHYSRSLSLYEDIRFESGVAWALRNLGWVACHRGDNQSASRLFSRSLDLYLLLDNRLGIIHTLAGLAAVHAVAGDGEQAAHLLGASEALRSTITIPMFICERSDHQFTLSALEEFLDEKQLQDARAQGRKMTVEQVMVFARAYQNRLVFS